MGSISGNIEGPLLTINGDYLGHRLLVSPQAFASDWAELVHLKEQISSLDDLSLQLSMLRHALHHHSYQLHSQLPPIHTLPVEILSYIFRLLVVTEYYCYWDFEKCLRQAIALTSVSFYFRHVAFGTPELWDKIKIQINHEEEVGSAASLIRHCVALTPTINIAICIKLLGWDYWEEDIFPIIDALLTPDTTSKIRFLMLSDAQNLWGGKVNASSFPMLDALCISSIPDSEFNDDFIFDLGMLATVTRVVINARYLEFHHGSKIILPSSVQYLELNDVQQDMLIPLLEQCPNLVECTVGIKRSDRDDFHILGLLTMAKLERFTCIDIDDISILFMEQNLYLPSLNFLKIERYKDAWEATPFIRSVSDTITTLVINGFYETYSYGELETLAKLRKTSFPKLETMELYSIVLRPFSCALRALELLEHKCKKSRRRNFPALRSIVLGYSADDIDPRMLVDLLEWEIGEVFYFDIRFDAVDTVGNQWSPELREELKSTIGNRRIEVTWGTEKVYELGAQDGSIRE